MLNLFNYINKRNTKKNQSTRTLYKKTRTTVIITLFSPNLLDHFLTIHIILILFLSLDRHLFYIYLELYIIYET